MVMERLIAVWFPLKVQLFCTSRKVIICIAVITIAVSGLNVPTIVNAIATHNEAVQNGGVVFVGKLATVLELNRHNNLMSESTDILMRLNRIVLDFTPIVLIIMSNIFIVVGLRKSVKKIERMTSGSQKDSNKLRRIQSRQITKMLFGISCAFVVLCSPNDFLFVLVYYFQVQNANNWIYIMFDVLSTTNHAINFIFYGAVNASYRRRYLQLLLCKKRGRNRRGTSVESRSYEPDSVMSESTRI